MNSSKAGAGAGASSAVIAVAVLTAACMPSLADAQFDVVFTNASNVPISQPAEYECNFLNNWSGANHPRLYPGDDAHWSPPVMASHNSDYRMWAAGSFASPGVELVAETGSTSTLREELTLAGESIGSSLVGVSTFNFEEQEQTFKRLLQVDANHSMMSSITMIAPSPDWFSGFYDFDLVDTSMGVWFHTFILDTYPFDAGTETGEVYSPSNDPEDPILPIEEFTSSNPIVSTGVFLTSDSSSVLPVARWSCTLLTTTLVDDTPAPAPTAEPPVVVPCKATFETCTSNADCCSGLCDTRLLTAATRQTCRSSPKLSRAKLSGETRGGAAASSSSTRDAVITNTAAAAATTTTAAAATTTPSGGVGGSRNKRRGLVRGAYY